MIPETEQQTMFCITLDNGIDYIRTPYTVLEEGAKVNQEFSLYVSEMPKNSSIATDVPHHAV